MSASTGMSRRMLLAGIAALAAVLAVGFSLLREGGPRRPQMPVSQLEAIARQANGVPSEITATVDLGTAVWHGHRCRSFHFYGRPQLGYTPLSSVTVDAETGEVLSVAQAG